MAWFRRRLRQEDGISLIEMLVSIMILGLVLAALASTMFSSMASARQNEGMTQATAVANELLETLQSAQWSTLNVGSPAPLPATVTRGNRTYNVTSNVAWVDQPYLKRYTVTLNWTVNQRPHTLSVEGRRAARSGENSSNLCTSCNLFRVLSFTITPDPVMLDSTGKSLAATNPALPGNGAMAFDIELNEAARANSVIVSWPTNQTLTLTEVAGSGGKKWTGTVPSGITYTAGWMNFRVTAAKFGTTTTCTATPQPTGGNCTESNSAAYLMAPIADGPLYYDDNNQRLYSGTPGKTGDRMCVSTTTFRLRNNYPFYLGLKGLGTDDTVILKRLDNGAEFPMTWTKVQANWWWYADVSPVNAGAMTLNQNVNWEIKWIRSYDNLSSTIPLTFHVMDANGTSACGT